jgi:hypothetical protein
MRVGKVVAVICIAAAKALFGAQGLMTVVVFDYAAEPDATVKRAVEAAHTPFRTAGVPTDWWVCRHSEDPNEHCALPAGTYVQVMVVRQWEGHTEGREAMGLALTFAGKQGVVCYVLVEPSKALAERTSQPAAVVLGCVMAHEIGHLMGLRHGPNGIMKPKFERRDIQDATMGNLHFANCEAKALRAPLTEADGPGRSIDRTTSQSRQDTGSDPTLSCPYHS